MMYLLWFNHDIAMGPVPLGKRWDWPPQFNFKEWNKFNYSSPQIRHSNLSQSQMCIGATKEPLPWRFGTTLRQCKCNQHDDRRYDCLHRWTSRHRLSSLFNLITRLMNIKFLPAHIQIYQFMIRVNCYFWWTVLYRGFPNGGIKCGMNKGLYVCVYYWWIKAYTSGYWRQN